MKIEAVLFDLDNTLTHRGRSVRAYSEYLAQHYAPVLFNAEIDQIEAIVNRIDRGGYPLKEQLTHPSIGASVAYALLQELQWKKPTTLDELTAFWFQYFGACAVAMPEAREMLSTLKTQGYRLAVVSNGGHSTRCNILQGLGFTDFFDAIISSEQAGVSKPHQGVFEYACQQLGVEASACLFVGDHPINDIQGAQNVGMQALWLTGFHEAEVTAPTIHQLSEILTYVKR